MLALVGLGILRAVEFRLLIDCLYGTATDCRKRRLWACWFCTIGSDRRLFCMIWTGRLMILGILEVPDLTFLFLERSSNGGFDIDTVEFCSGTARTTILRDWRWSRRSCHLIELPCTKEVMVNENIRRFWITIHAHFCSSYNMNIVCLLFALAFDGPELVDEISVGLGFLASGEIWPIEL